MSWGANSQTARCCICLENFSKSELWHCGRESCGTKELWRGWAVWLMSYVFTDGVLFGDATTTSLFTSEWPFVSKISDYMILYLATCWDSSNSIYLLPHFFTYEKVWCIIASSPKWFVVVFIGRPQLLERRFAQIVFDNMPRHRTFDGGQLRYEVVPKWCNSKKLGSWEV